MLPGDYKIHEPGIIVALFNMVVPITEYSAWYPQGGAQ